MHPPTSWESGGPDECCPLQLPAHTETEAQGSENLSLVQGCREEGWRGHLEGLRPLPGPPSGHAARPHAPQSCFSSFLLLCLTLAFLSLFSLLAHSCLFFSSPKEFLNPNKRLVEAEAESTGWPGRSLAFTSLPPCHRAVGPRRALGLPEPGWPLRGKSGAGRSLGLSDRATGANEMVEEPSRH